MKRSIQILLLLLGYAILLIIDFGANVLLGWIPWLGAFLNMINEFVIEIGQGILVLILAVIAGKE